MRLFLAINFPEDVKNALSSGMTALARRGVRANWSRRENLHLTLEFLGEVRDAAPVVEAMERVKAHKFSICFTDTGRFRRDGGDIFWLGVARTEPLMLLQAQLHEALRREGLRLERRPYRPHLTLARRLRERGEIGVPAPLPGAIPVKGFSLMQSDRVEGRLRYTQLYWKELED